MGQSISTRSVRTREPWPLLAAVCAVGLLAAAHAGAQEQSEWKKIDCASEDAHLVPPSGVQADCFEGPFSQVTGQYDCRLSNYSFGYPAEGTEPRSYARLRYPKKGGKSCATMLFTDPVKAMRHEHKFVESDATHWSQMQSIGSDVQVMFFDAKNQKRDGKCFTFTKYGPPAGRAGQGRSFTMIGFFCKAPGQPLDTAAAAAMVSAIKLKTL